MSKTLNQTELPLSNRRQGKVRDIYDAELTDGTPVLLIIASDRISAFDVVMPDGIPGKGVVLTQISRFWFDMIQRKLGDRLKHHLLATNADNVRGLNNEQRRQLAGRVMVGRRCRVVPIECVVRGYLAGSGWKEYQQSQQVCGVKLPAGLRQCDKLPEPIFTPATKEATGHDINISYEQACELQGAELVTRLRDLSIAIYRMAHEHAASCGIILADTKFEFGIPLDDPAGGAILIDEVLTPDSSRFWPANKYQPGRDQESFDKQFLRNYLESLVAEGKWHKSPPGPPLPPHIVQGTLDKYLEAHKLLTGHELAV